MNTSYYILLLSNNDCDYDVTKRVSEEIVQSTHAKVEINMCKDYSALYKSVFENKYLYDLFILDFDDFASINIAKIFTYYEIDKPVVFITSNPINKSYAYGIRLMDYLFRPIDQNILKRMLLHNIRLNANKDKLILKKNSNSFCISMNSIVCIEACGRGVKIYLSDFYELASLSQQPDLKKDIDFGEKAIYCNVKISEFSKMLNPALFIKCHQSFIINLEKTVSLRRYSAILENGKNNGMIVYVSKSRYDSVKQRFQDKEMLFSGDKCLTEMELLSAPGGLTRETFMKMLGEMSIDN